MSWRILVPDLAAAWQAMAAGEAAALPPRAPRSGAGRSGSRRRRRARRCWRSCRSGARMLAGAVRCGCSDGRARCRARHSRAAAGHLTLTLPAAVTHGAADAGAGGVPWRHQRRAADRRSRWRSRTGAGGSGRGRATAGPRRCWSISRATAARRCSAALDLSRTVGWFTSLYPVRLDLGAVDLDAALAGRRGARRGAQERSRSSCARCRTRGSAMACCAISTRETAAAACRLRGAAARLQLSGPVRGAAAAADWACCAEDGVRLGGGDPAMPLAHARRDQRADARRRRWPELCRATGPGRRRCWPRRRCATLARELVCGRWRRWCAHAEQAGRRRPHAERPAAGCADAGRDRAAGAGIIRGSRTCCRCRRCRKACCSMRCTTRRRRTSTRCSSSWSSTARSTARALAAAAQALVDAARQPAGGLPPRRGSRRPVQVIVRRRCGAVAADRSVGA